MESLINRTGGKKGEWEYSRFTYNSEENHLFTSLQWVFML